MKQFILAAGGSFLAGIAIIALPVFALWRLTRKKRATTQKEESMATPQDALNSVACDSQDAQYIAMHDTQGVQTGATCDNEVKPPANENIYYNLQLEA